MTTPEPPKQRPARPEHPRLGPAEIDELAELARALAVEAGALALDGFRRPRSDVRHKGAVDLVTETDLAVEALIRERLERETGFAFYGEEGGRTGPEGGPAWIVDPIDGTTNFANRIPYFAVSIGLWQPAGSRLEPACGVVFAPAVDECFWCDATTARLGDTPLPPLTPKPLGECVLASGFPYDRQTNPDNNIDLWQGFMRRCRGVRRFGAAALDIAWLAAGRVDGFWEARLKPWDVAAGLALLDRVGGRATDFLGAPHHLESASLVAAHPALIGPMLQVIDTEWRARP